VHIGRTIVSFRVSCCCIFSSHCWLIFYPSIGKFIVYWLNVLSIYIHSFVLKFSAHIHAHDSFMFHKFHIHIYIIYLHYASFLFWNFQHTFMHMTALCSTSFTSISTLFVSRRWIIPSNNWVSKESIWAISGNSVITEFLKGVYGRSLQNLSCESSWKYWFSIF
jgi:hypothetical protein